MAGELKQGSLQSIKQSKELSAFNSASKPFKSAAIAAVASTAGGSPDGVTPRKYIKALHQCVRTLDKHRHHLPVEVVKALKVRKQLQIRVCCGQQLCCTVVAAGGWQTQAHKNVICIALQDLDTVVKEAAHSHSAAAKGKLRYFLQEGKLLLPA
jgi:hypothetical protein